MVDVDDESSTRTKRECGSIMVDASIVVTMTAAMERRMHIVVDDGTRHCK